MTQSFSQAAIEFVGGASGWGAQRRETEQGPLVLLDGGIVPHLREQGFDVSWDMMVCPEKTARELSLPVGAATLPFVTDHCTRLAKAVQQVLTQGSFPVVVGGDHAIAIGTWSGVVDHLQAYENFGLIWIDAHMDAHTPQTSPSQAYHGMPVAALMGHGEKSLTEVLQARPKINPAHVALVGIRSYEEGEQALLQQLGVKIFYMEDIHARGFDVCMGEAVSNVSAGGRPFGISLDLDAFDPQVAPGVGSPETDGLFPEQVLPVFARVRNHPQLKAFEVTEFNPQRDQDNLTYQLLTQVLESLLPRSAESYDHLQGAHCL